MARFRFLRAIKSPDVLKLRLGAQSMNIMRFSFLSSLAEFGELLQAVCRWPWLTGSRLSPHAVLNATAKGLNPLPRFGIYKLGLEVYLKTCQFIVDLRIYDFIRSFCPTALAVAARVGLNHAFRHRSIDLEKSHSHPPTSTQHIHRRTRSLSLSLPLSLLRLLACYV